MSPRQRPWATWPWANAVHAAWLRAYRAVLPPGGGRRQGVWIDVGAHLGEKTLYVARANPNLRVYAFEPNLAVAARLVGVAPNFWVLPMAVAEEDGCARFNINANDVASSLLDFDARGLARWRGGESLRVETTVTVPTVRLDTFMRLVGIKEVDFLKIDAQGADLAVLRSAGNRLRSIRRIEVEVALTPIPLYSGAATRTDILTYLQTAGFRLVRAEPQSYAQEENLFFERRVDHLG